MHRRNVEDSFFNRLLDFFEPCHDTLLCLGNSSGKNNFLKEKIIIFFGNSIGDDFSYKVVDLSRSLFK